MSKKPVPKKQQAKSSSRSRHSKYAAEQRKRLENGVQLTTCSHCGEKRRVHYACGECGFYRGRQVLGTATKAAGGSAKVTEIKA